MGLRQTCVITELPEAFFDQLQELIFLCVFELLRVDNILSHRAVTWPKMVDQILAPPSKTHASLDLISLCLNNLPGILIDRTYLLQFSSSFVAMPKAGSECSSGLLLGNRSCDISNALFFHSQTRRRPASLVPRPRAPPGEGGVWGRDSYYSQRRNETHRAGSDVKARCRTAKQQQRSKQR